MIKQIIIIVLSLCLSTVHFGCRHSDPTNDNNLPSDQESVQEGDSQESELTDVDNDNGIPGAINTDRVLDDTADWAEYADGISRTEAQINLNPWFDTDDVNEIVIGYRSISLEDGSIIGYVKFKGIVVTSDGSVENGEESYDLIVGRISDIAESMNLVSYTELWAHHMYFIISNPEGKERLIGYLIKSHEGYTIDMAMMGNK